MNPAPSLRERLTRWGRILTLRASHHDYASLDRRDFLLGLAATWIVGMGRYWDDPRAGILQHLGVGSVVYIFALTALLYLIAKVLSPSTVRAGNILTFVSLTSAPAILYAIPVELWMTMKSANMVNLWFLLIVALWRVCMLGHYLKRACSMSVLKMLVGTLMPLAFIFITLVWLNLHHVVFDIMGGIREADQSSQDLAYEILFLLSILATPLSALCALAWLIYGGINLRHGSIDRKAEKQPEN